MLEFGNLQGGELPQSFQLLGSGRYVYSGGLKPMAGAKGKSTRTSAFYPLSSNFFVAERLGITNALVLNLIPRALSGIADYTAPKKYEPLGETLRIAASRRREIYHMRGDHSAELLARWRVGDC